MNKILLLLGFLLFFGHAKAQDSLVVAKETTVIAPKSNEENIIVDRSSDVKLKQFQTDFKKKYTDDAFVYDPQKAEKGIWQQFKEYLIYLLIKIFRFSDPKSSILLLKIIASLIVLFVVYLLIKALINKEGQWIFGKNSNKKKIQYSEIEKNIHLMDFEKLIAENLNLDNKRLCIRYYYLWLLKVMAQNHFIDWHVDKTNSDYLYEIQNQALKEEFIYLSYLYNYTWYGEFDIDENRFKEVENRFKTALKTFGNE